MKNVGKIFIHKTSYMEIQRIFSGYLSYPHLLTKFQVDKNVDKLSTCLKTGDSVERL